MAKYVICGKYPIVCNLFEEMDDIALYMRAYNQIQYTSDLYWKLQMRENKVQKGNEI